MKDSLLQKNWNEIRDFFSKETKKHTLFRYLILILIIIGYFTYESKKLGAGNGLLVTMLTWCFFVFCTPIADAGFVLAFPVRLLANIRMVYTQVFSYVVALVIVVFAHIYKPGLYGKTILLKLFHIILTNPYPYWIILLTSLIGTLFSIYFGDELIDVNTHKEREKYHRHLNKYKLVVTLFIVFMTITLYDFFLQKLGIKIPLL